MCWTRWTGSLMAWLLWCPFAWGGACDVNADGRVTPVDAQICIEAYAAGRSINGCDVNGDGVVTPDDARRILEAVHGGENICPPTDACELRRRKQMTAYTGLRSLANGMREYLEEYLRYAESLDELGALIPHDASYSFQVSADNGVSPRAFLLTAVSLPPGITGNGAGDDVWTLDESGVMTHPVDAVPSCEAIPSPCFSCRERQVEGVSLLKKAYARQWSHFHEYGEFATVIVQLGLESNAWYGLSIEDVSPSGFLIRMASLAPGIAAAGAGDDSWIMDAQGIQTHVADACSQCLMPSGPCSTDCALFRSWQHHAVAQLHLIREKLLARKSAGEEFTADLAGLGYSPCPTESHAYGITLSGGTFEIVAASLAPGIAGRGAHDDVWRMTADGVSVHEKNPATLCPPDEVVFPGYTCKARQSQAKSGLDAIARAQHIRFAAQGAYTDQLHVLDITLSGYDRYDFSIASISSTGFTGIAISRIPGIWGRGEGDDIWRVNEKFEWEHTVNGCDWRCGATGGTP